MNEDLTTFIEPELEARLVALVLGEASAFEREELERVMTERPEARLFKTRLEILHGLVGEAANPVNAIAWKLSDKRREKVLARLRDPQATAKPAEKPQRSNFTRRLIFYGSAACFIAVIGGLSTPAVLKTAKSSTSMADKSERFQEEGLYLTTANESASVSAENDLNLWARQPEVGTDSLASLDSEYRLKQARVAGPAETRSSARNLLSGIDGDYSLQSEDRLALGLQTENGRGSESKPSGESTGDNFQNMTEHSTGSIANVRDGGLKRNNSESLDSNGSIDSLSYFASGNEGTKEGTKEGVERFRSHLAESGSLEEGIVARKPAAPSASLNGVIAAHTASPDEVPVPARASDLRDGFAFTDPPAYAFSGVASGGLPADAGISDKSDLGLAKKPTSRPVPDAEIAANDTRFGLDSNSVRARTSTRTVPVVPQEATSFDVDTDELDAVALESKRPSGPSLGNQPLGTRAIDGSISKDFIEPAAEAASPAQGLARGGMGGGGADSDRFELPGAGRVESPEAATLTLPATGRLFGTTAATENKEKAPAATTTSLAAAIVPDVRTFGEERESLVAGMETLSEDFGTAEKEITLAKKQKAAYFDGGRSNESADLAKKEPSRRAGRVVEDLAALGDKLERPMAQEVELLERQSASSSKDHSNSDLSLAATIDNQPQELKEVARSGGGLSLWDETAPGDADPFGGESDAAAFGVVKREAAVAEGLNKDRAEMLAQVDEAWEAEVPAVEEQKKSGSPSRSLAENEELQEQADLVQENRKQLTSLIQQYGIPYFDGRAGNPVGSTEEDLYRTSQRKLEEAEAQKEQLNLALKKLEVPQSDDLVRTAAGLELLGNNVGYYETRYREALDESKNLLSQGMGTNHPAVVSAQERADSALKLAGDEVTNLKQVLTTKLALIDQSTEKMREALDSKQNATVDLSLKQHHYNQALEDYEQSRDMYREMKIKLMENSTISPQELGELEKDDPILGPQASVLAKLDLIRLPELSFETAPVKDVLEKLRLTSVEFDGSSNDFDERGINIVGFLPEGSSVKSLDLSNLTLQEALAKVAENAGLDFDVDEFAVTISAKSPENWKPQISGDERSKETSSRLDKVISPQFALNDARVSEATEFLTYQMKELSPGSPPIEFQFDHAGIGNLKIDQLALKNVPFEVALKYIADKTVTRYRIDGNKVIFYSDHVPNPVVSDTTFETSTAEKSDSTFSLNVSDVSFKLAKSSLAEGKWPEAAKVRPEEFVNALSYGDDSPTQAEKIACVIEQGSHPFMQQRDLMRVSMSTAALGRNASTPLRLTVLLDQSGSMERADRAESVRRAFALLAAQLNAGDEITLIGFARTPRLLAERVKGDEAEKLVGIVSNPLTEGGTNLEAALASGLQLAKQQFVEGAQNRIILLTDGAANLGDALPENLAKQVATMRAAGIAFDACGVGADGLNDDILTSLAKQADGRYYFLDRPEDADDGFARQIAGALRPAASNVKVQVLFNPERVSKFKLYGFEKHQLKKEDFRNDRVDAAEMAAEESGVALYHFEAMPEGQGDIGTVSVRFLDNASKQMVERTWAIPYEPNSASFAEANPNLRLASVAGLFAEKLMGSPVGARVDLKRLRQEAELLKPAFQGQTRFQELQTMLQLAGE